jgi:hypothetical protein
MIMKAVKINFVSLCTVLLAHPIYAQTTCPPILDGIYVTDDNADEVGKEGKHENVLRLLKKIDPNWAATTLGFSVALLRNGDQLSLYRNIGNDLDEQHTNLSVRAEARSPATCDPSGAWTLQTTQYYPEELNFFGKPRRKAKKLPEPVRIQLWLEPIEVGVLRISDCKAEVQEAGKWRAFSKYDSVDLCLNLKSSKLFDIRPSVQGRKGWQGVY